MNMGACLCDQCGNEYRYNETELCGACQRMQDKRTGK